MAARRFRPTTSPALVAFGTQVQRLRDAKGMTQESLAKHASVTNSYISKVENGKTRTNRGFVETIDGCLDANGALISLWDDLNQEGHPVPLWFDWPEVEKEAVELITWELAIIPGLLQIEDYARAFLTAEGAVTRRMERQQVITREEKPAKLVALIKEEALYNLIVSKEVMRAQLEHLLKMSELPNVTIQIVVNDGLPAGTSGAFVVATMEDRSQVAHMDTVIRGITTDDPADLTAISNVLIALRGKTLTVGMSRDAIRKAIDQRWT
ncbi:helix-turn-helix domain-containing protein [Spirillospora sp. NPDC127200]